MLNTAPLNMVMTWESLIIGFSTLFGYVWKQDTAKFHALTISVHIKRLFGEYSPFSEQQQLFVKYIYIHTQVVPHKAVAEVSEEETYRRAWLLWITDGRANPLMDWKGGCCFFFEWLQWLQWSPGRSPHPQLLDVVWCSAAVVVLLVSWRCSCGVV